MMNVALSAILAEISRAFPGTPTSIVQMITVIPGMVALPFSLLAGKVATLITKKTMALFSMVVMLLGGLIPLAAHSSIELLLLSSAIVGMGSGFLIPVTSSLVADFFEGHERSTMMGLQAALINTGGVVFAILGGALAQFQWYYTYLIFLLIIPAIIVFAAMLPQGEVVKDSGSVGLGLNRTIAYLSMASFFFGLLSTTYSTNVALYLDATHLGDATSAAIAISLFSCVGIIAGLLFGRTSRVLKQYTLPVALGAAALGLALTYVGGSLLMVFAGGLLIGYGLSTLMPYGVFTATQTVAPAATSLAIAVFTASVSLGSFGSPMLINTVAGLTGDGSEKARFLVAAVGLSVLFAVVLLRELRQRRRGVETL
jgi:MFS family permease